MLNKAGSIFQVEHQHHFRFTLKKGGGGFDFYYKYLCKKRINTRSLRFKVFMKLFIIFLLFIIFKLTIIDISSIDGRSMEPTLTDSDFVLINNVSYGLLIPLSKKYFISFDEVNKGSVVVIRDPTKKPFNRWIKRVIATAGDSISILNKILYLNRKKISCINKKVINQGNFTCEETLVEGATYTVKQSKLFDEYQDELIEITVPQGYVFVLGDNRILSADSRTYGLIATSDVIGKEVAVFSDRNTRYAAFFVILVLLTFKSVCSQSKNEIAIKFKRLLS